MIFDWRQFCDVHTYFDHSYEWSHGGLALSGSSTANGCFMLMMQQG